MNAPESVARVVKAEDFADVLQAANCDAAAAEKLSDRGWAAATALVAEKRRRPVSNPSPATRAAVMALLRRREAEKDDDPWAGIEGVASR